MKSLDMKPNNGAPYLLIGKMYAATAKSVYPNDGVLARAVYYAAVDKFEKARQVDPSCADEANSLIGSYRAHFPSTEEVFMHPDLEKGQAITIGGWTYLPNKDGAYGGFLPTVTDWTQMNFSGPGKYIWFKTTGSGLVSATGCLSGGDPQWMKNVLTWGASVSWKSGASSPTKPTN